MNNNTTSQSTYEAHVWEWRTRYRNAMPHAREEMAAEAIKDATYWRKRTDEYSLQLAHTHNHAEALAEALRHVLVAYENPNDHGQAYQKAEAILAAYEIANE